MSEWNRDAPSGQTDRQAGGKDGQICIRWSSLYELDFQHRNLSQFYPPHITTNSLPNITPPVTVCSLNISLKTLIHYINTCLTICNTKHSIYSSASSLYMFRVSTTPIISSTQNCNYSLRYWSYF